MKPALTDPPITRYEIVGYPHPTEPFGEITMEDHPRPTGGWVRWSDVETLFTRADVAMLKDLHLATIGMSANTNRDIFSLIERIEALLPPPPANL